MKTIEQISEETKWWGEVQAYAKLIEHEVSNEMLDEWIESYYQDGYTAKQAVDEDQSYND